MKDLITNKADILYIKLAKEMTIADKYINGLLKDFSVNIHDDIIKVDERVVINDDFNDAINPDSILITNDQDYFETVVCTNTFKYIYYITNDESDIVKYKNSESCNYFRETCLDSLDKLITFNVNATQVFAFTSAYASSIPVFYKFFHIFDETQITNLIYGLNGQLWGETSICPITIHYTSLIDSGLSVRDALWELSDSYGDIDEDDVMDFYSIYHDYERYHKNDLQGITILVSEKSYGVVKPVYRIRDYDGIYVNLVCIKDDFSGFSVVSYPQSHSVIPDNVSSKIEFGVEKQYDTLSEFNTIMSQLMNP